MLKFLEALLQRFKKEEFLIVSYFNHQRNHGALFEGSKAFARETTEMRVTEHGADRAELKKLRNNRWEVIYEYPPKA